MLDEGALQDICRYIVTSGEEMNASAIEVQARSITEVGAQIENDEISGVNSRNEDQIAIRLYLGKRVGSTFINISTRDAAKNAIAMALSSAKATASDENWYRLPELKRSTKINGLWDRGTAQCPPSKIVELTSELLSLAKSSEKGLIAAWGGTAAIKYCTAYANSNGINHTERATITNTMLGAIAQTQMGVTPMITSYDVKRGLDLEIKRVVDEVASNIRICKHEVKGKTGNYPIIMHPNAYGQLLYYTLLQSIRGDNVVRGKSKLKEKVGEKIASDTITMLDDGTNTLGANTSMRDDEGVPRQRTHIIEKGVLKGFLWDNYWANRTNTDSTGNATRIMRQGLMEPQSTNTVIEQGKREIGDILAGIKNGYLIRNLQGAHSSNPESGDYSLVGNPAILIEDGEMIGAVHGLMLAGNIYELLKQCIETARTPHILQNMIGPEILLEEMRVISQ